MQGFKSLYSVSCVRSGTILAHLSDSLRIREEVVAAQRQPLAQPLRITPVETAELLSRGHAITVDVRSADDYANGHIPGALWSPLNRLGSLLPKLPRGKTIVFY